MEYIIGSVILIVIIIAIALFWRKREYKEVDQLEAAKLDIQHRPILEEMTKVKQLNMNGQTEELFEGWRASWIQVVDVKLAEADTLLFDAEEYIDKFRFKKSREIRDKIRHMLSDAEKEMNLILEELEELMGSDEKNKEEMAAIQADYQHAKNELFSQRHTYGKASEAIERKIDAVEPKLTQYREMTEQGNYLAARELVLTLADEVAYILLLLQEIPELYNETHYSIPSQLSELKEGFEEMRNAGFPLSHISIEEDAAAIQSSINKGKTHVNQLEMDDAKRLVAAMHQHIDTLYDSLEKEVEARSYVTENWEGTTDLLNRLIEQNQALQTETEFVRQGYQLDQNDFGIPKDLDKKLLRIEKKFSILKERRLTSDTAFSALSGELEGIRTELHEIEPAQTDFKDRLQRLRQDEVRVREIDHHLRGLLKEQERLLRHANLPRCPEYISAQFDSAYDQLDLLEKSLNDKPLNIISIQQHSSTSEAMVESVCKETEEMIQSAQSVERVIQYGNRYRSRHETVYIGLNEAELLFRKGQYQDALEQAASAIEKVEPGALKRIEELSGSQIEEKQFAKQ
ncbi:septation ring formation regulator EzrA [Jeotgalibacillus sp. ET6]|uniref:septation ring formation regulator EzrA n=1 Tax=Jeotgalibacillus sp. ET6 TaxID=3037260 RepID=UPI0024187AC5|nr:septation ring formation regulator EzrA [Jeotgalibacillus sp. ET6]MDG5471081.1 septation ring formation regulator EzrA [Jeotgalibacillus sp. ET6]